MAGEGWCPFLGLGSAVGFLVTCLEAIENELLTEIRSGQDELMLTSKAISLTGIDNELGAVTATA